MSRPISGTLPIIFFFELFFSDFLANPKPHKKTVTCMSFRSKNYSSWSPNTSSHTMIPVELYRPIFEHIRNSSYLARLCTVSHTFQREVEPLLYHTIILPPSRSRIWSETIAQNS